MTKHSRSEDKDQCLKPLYFTPDSTVLKWIIALFDAPIFMSLASSERTVLCTYIIIIFAVDIRSLVNQTFQCIHITSSSCHMKGISLVESKDTTIHIQITMKAMSQLLVSVQIDIQWYEVVLLVRVRAWPFPSGPPTLPSHPHILSRTPCQRT